MEAVYISGGVFAMAVISHMVVHRLFRREKRAIGMGFVAAVYGGYLVGLVYVLFGLIGGESFRWTGLLFYILCSCLISILYFPLGLSGQTPADEILEEVEKHPKGATKQDILRLFSERELIDVRLGQLQTAGVVGKKGEKFFLTPKGRWCWMGMRVVMSLFTNEVGG